MGFLVAKGYFGVSPFRHVVIQQAGNEQTWTTSQAAGTSPQDITLRIRSVMYSAPQVSMNE
jgi:hypothetical protein